MLLILRTLPMLRTAFLSVLMLALLAVSAGAAATHKSRTHKTAATAHAVHSKARSTAVRAAKRHTRKTRRSAARRRVQSHHAHAIHATYTRMRRHPAPMTEAENDSPAPDAAASAQPATDTSPEDSPAQAPAPASLRVTRIVPVAPLRGSAESLARQNLRTDQDHLERILNSQDLDDRIARGMLVPVPTSSALSVNQNLPQDRRYCRPWTASFLHDLARAHQQLFHTPLEVSSAVRTVDYQKRLIGMNGNAAAAEGDVVSPHVTGATIDIAKHGMSAREIYWMRGRLLALQNEGKLDVEEEFQQACFHITVYKSYAPEPPAHSPHTPPRRRAATPPPARDNDGADSEPAPSGVASRGR